MSSTIENSSTAILQDEIYICSMKAAEEEDLAERRAHHVFLFLMALIGLILKT